MLSSLRMPLPRLSNEGDDPFSQYTKPPPHETDDEKSTRLRREAEEKRVNDEIDEYIKAEKAALKKRKTEIKLLLLGQSESGMSPGYLKCPSQSLKTITVTLCAVHRQIYNAQECARGCSPSLCCQLTLLDLIRSDFQLTFAPKAWRTERASWRAVIQFNLVHAVNIILDVLCDEMLSPPGTTGGSNLSAPYASGRGSGSWSMEDLDANLSSDDEDQAPGFQSLDAASVNLPPLKFESTHQLLKLRLAPLRSVEKDLKTFLGAGSDELSPTMGQTSEMVATPFESTYSLKSSSLSRRRTNEFAVRSHASWKKSLGFYTGNSKSRPQSPNAEMDLERATGVIAGCKDDIRLLWEDSVIQELLKRRGVKLTDSVE